jgi:hypothetical protein
MLRSLAAEKASRQRLRQRLAQERGFGWWKHRAWGAVAQAEHHPMAKSNPVDETRIAEPVNPIKPQPCVNLKKAPRIAKAQKRRTRSNAVGSRHCAKPASGKQTKQQTCLDLLGRREGATIEDLEERPLAGRNTVCAASWPLRSKRSSASHWYRRSPTRAPAVIASQTRPERHGPECVGGAQRAPKARR